LRQFFYQNLGENTCSSQPALKNTAPAFKTELKLQNFNAEMCFSFKLNFAAY